jgi:cytochrome c biogenesis protein CcmG/thiol:disulfide interchange protein DsbE
MTSRGFRRHAQLAVTLVIALACGSSIASRTGTTPEVAARELGPPLRVAHCPEDIRAPVAGRTATVLPCLTDPSGLVRIVPGSGQTEVINVWASWCEPCRREAQVLDTAYRAAGDRVLFLGIDSRDERGAAERFLRGTAVSYPQAFDPEGAVARRLGIPGVPYTVVVEASGEIVLRQLGQLSEQALSTALARAGVP